MVNCIGAVPEPSTILGLPGVHLHRYGKAPRPGRKVGHVTVTAPDAELLAHRLAALRRHLPADVG
jgi:5-(carboxyamino)imidazole ribonucleotide synthase